jgi:P pilus assembly chaperone PapD
MKFLLKKILICAAFTALSFVSLAFPAKASLTITPTIVVIDGRDRFADINLVNTTQEPQTYELAWKFLGMQEGTGSYQGIDKPTTDFDVTQNVIFTPRRVTIQPGGTQRVRLALRLKSAAPPPGDYRAHLVMVNKAARGRDVDTPAGEEAQASVNMNVGFSIPVIYRVGDVDGGDATIGNITTEIDPKSNRIKAIVPITRNKGTYGTVGTLTIYYRGQKVGQILNANIFPEVQQRIFHVTLNTSSLSGGSLEVVYSDYDAAKDHIFDKKAVNIAN